MSDRLSAAIKKATAQPPEHGSVKWFHASKGYGFISPDGINAMDRFLHASDLEKAGIDPRSVVEGDRFIYEIGAGRDGRPMATALRRE